MAGRGLRRPRHGQPRRGARPFPRVRLRRPRGRPRAARERPHRAGGGHLPGGAGARSASGRGPHPGTVGGWGPPPGRPAARHQPGSGAATAGRSGPLRPRGGGVTGGVTGGETGGPPAGILGWADRPGARRLLAAARHKVEDGVGRRGSLGPLTPTERDDARVLLGVAWDASGREPTLGDLRDALARHGVELEELLVRFGGPVRDRFGERRARAAARAEETHAALEVVAAAVSDAARTGALPVGPHAAGLGDAVAQEILRRCLPPAGTGARLARARELAEMLRALPPAGAEPVLLAVLAARTFGDAHALDQSRPLGRAGARLVAVLDPAAADRDAIGWVDPVGSAELWRAAWAGVGVACDTVSSQVLTLNLTLQGTSPAVALTAAAHGEP
ncbi:MAG: hypothetical protein EOL91_05360, partial [Actinobacteria bacterium]|nr:hypothetical protein [Actinomycetota bacterium]